MTVDVFDHDHRIVDQARKGQSQAAQDHGVDGLAHRMKHEKRNHHREWNRQKHGHRGPEAAQKQQNHHAGQEDADAAFAQHRGDGFLDEHRLVENHAGLQLRRNIAQRQDGLADSIDHRDRVRIAALLLHAARRRISARPRARCCTAATSRPRPCPRRKQRPIFWPSVLSGTSLSAWASGNLRVGVDVVVHRPDAHVAGRQDQIGASPWPAPRP